MSKHNKYGLRDFKRMFPTEDSCLAYLFTSLHSRKCSCGGVYKRIPGRKQYQCSTCRFQIAPMAGTIFEKSTTPLLLWFHAIFVFSNAKSGVSAKEMERQLNVTYKTAWRILFLIRKSLKQDKRKLRGVVEMDDGYFGGHSFAGKGNKGMGYVLAKKVKVIAAQERGGSIRAKILSKGGAKDFVQEYIEPSSVLMTDETNHYVQAARGYNRKTVNHSKKQYSEGGVHVNNIENFWSHVKRSIKGTHKVISRQHFQSYLDGFVFLRNNQHNDRLRFEALFDVLLPLKG